MSAPYLEELGRAFLDGARDLHDAAARVGMVVRAWFILTWEEWRHNWRRH
jgi:hypothetical protein